MCCYFSGIEICCNKYGINIFAQSLYEENDDIVHAIMSTKHNKKGNSEKKSNTNTKSNTGML